jgi:DNA-binding MarR family transcriptional regulator
MTSTFEERFGILMRVHGITAIPAALWRYQGELGLTPAECWLLATLLSYQWQREAPYPSLRRIGRETGVSRQLLQHHLRALERKGYVKIERRQTPRGRDESSRYHLEGLFTALEALVRAENRRQDAHVTKGGGQIYLPGRANIFAGEGKYIGPQGKHICPPPVDNSDFPKTGAKKNVDNFPIRSMVLDSHEVEDGPHSEKKEDPERASTTFRGAAMLLCDRFGWIRAARGKEVEARLSEFAAVRGLDESQAASLALRLGMSLRQGERPEMLWQMLDVAVVTRRKESADAPEELHDDD